MAIHCSRSRRQGIVAAAGFFLLALVTAPAQAQLAGLIHDPGTGELSVASIDSATGVVTPAAVTVVDCCRLASGLIAADPTGERFFAMGVWTGGDNVDLPGLFRLNFDGSGVASVEIASIPSAILEYDALNDRLISAEVVGLATGLLLQSFDPVTGASAAIGAPNVDCCEIATGVSAMDSAGQRLFFAGRQAGESEWSVYSADLSTGTVVSEQTLPAGHPGFMAYDANTGFVQVLMQQTLAGQTQIIGVDLVNGGQLVLADHANADCCLLTLGQTPSQSEDGDFWWLSGANTTLATAALALSAEGSNGLTELQVLDTTGRLQALVVNGQTVSLDLLFQDRFEL